MKVTDEMIERGAKALLALHGGQEAVENYPKMPPHIRERWASRARAVLAAGLERLRAVHGITDEIVEAAARAMYERKRSLLEGIKPLPWDSIPHSMQDQWREIARAGLQAAGGVAAVHLCDTCASFKVCFFRRLFQSLIDEEAPPVRVRACVTECEQYKPDARVQEVLAGARQGSTSQGR